MPCLTKCLLSLFLCFSGICQAFAETDKNIDEIIPNLEGVEWESIDNINFVKYKPENWNGK